MKIVISLLNFRPGKIGGTETYLQQIVPRLSETAAAHELMLLVDRQQDADDLFPGIARCVVDMGSSRVLVERGLEAVSQYRCRAVEKVLDRIQPDVVFFPQQSIFPKNVACPCVLVVHDLYHIYLPQHLSPLQRFVRTRGYASSIDRAERVIAISQFTKDTVVEHYGINPNRVSVIPHGIRPAAPDWMPRDLEVTRPYLYYPAASLPHKNHAVLFKSIAQLKADSITNWFFPAFRPGIGTHCGGRSAGLTWSRPSGTWALSRTIVFSGSIVAPSASSSRPRSRVLDYRWSRPPRPARRSSSLV